LIGLINTGKEKAIKRHDAVLDHLEYLENFLHFVVVQPGGASEKRGLGGQGNVGG
jgi:hypothetical protein